MESGLCNEKEPSENPDFSSQDMNDRNMVMDRNRKPDPSPWDMNEQMNKLIQIARKKKNRKPPEGNVYDSAGPPFDYNDTSFVHIVDEALKGADMNPTWKRNIFSQRPEDDDEDLRQQIDDKLKHYNPDIAHRYWDHERYCILERRQYHKDISATEGFEVGYYYPYLGITCCNLINRYYCPPDANISADTLAHLYGLALYAIQIYNSKEQTLLLALGST